MEVILPSTVKFGHSSIQHAANQQLLPICTCPTYASRGCREGLDCQESMTASKWQWCRGWRSAALFIHEWPEQRFVSPPSHFKRCIDRVMGSLFNYFLLITEVVLQMLVCIFVVGITFAFAMVIRSNVAGSAASQERIAPSLSAPNSVTRYVENWPLWQNYKICQFFRGST